MARSRQLLHEKLKALLGSGNVYFQPPANLRMSYPAIVYRRDDRETSHADNLPYKDAKRYLVTVIDTDPDSSVPDAVADLPYSRFVRFYTANELNHDVYQVFY